MRLRSPFLYVAAVALLCVVVLSVAVSDVARGEEEVDFYEILGLEKERDDASERDIRSSFRKLSKQYHPDVAGEGSREKYQIIQRAYEVLGDRKKRKIYDIAGMEGVKKIEQPHQQQQAMNPFGFLFGGMQQPQQGGNEGENVRMLLLVTLEDVYNGAAHTVKFPKQKICRTCRGSGARSKDDLVACPHCNGEGVVMRRVQVGPMFVQNMAQPCSHCNGKGKHAKHKCPVCNGAQVVKGESTISIDVEQGTPEGHELKFEMEADQRPNQVPGDVILMVSTAPHDRFERDGDDLRMEVKISLKEALLGFDKLISHLDGHEVELMETGVTQHGSKQAIQGEGMPKHHVPSEKGTLHVTYTIDLPRHLTQEQKLKIEDLF